MGWGDLVPDGQEPLACVEVGGGSIQTVLFEAYQDFQLLHGAHQPPGAALAIAVPGLIEAGLVVEASNLGWQNVDPVVALELAGPASLVANDAEAAALGEAALRGERGLQRLVFIGIGTGIGGAVVGDGAVLRGNLFGHNNNGYGTSFGSLPCRCGRHGCLETVAAGWALPDPIDAAHLAHLASSVANAIDRHPLAQDGVVVLGGGIPRRYPVLIDLVGSRLHRVVEPSLAPPEAKSAAAWGLRFTLGAQSDLVEQAPKENA